MDEEHPLAGKEGREGEAYCPVVNVTWYLRLVFCGLGVVISRLFAERSGMGTCVS